MRRGFCLWGTDANMPLIFICMVCNKEQVSPIQYCPPDPPPPGVCERMFELDWQLVTIEGELWGWLCSSCKVEAETSVS